MSDTDNSINSYDDYTSDYSSDCSSDYIPDTLSDKTIKLIEKLKKELKAEKEENLILSDKLEDYRKLKDIGNIYQVAKNKECYTVKEFLYRILPREPFNMGGKSIDKLLDFRSVIDDNGCLVKSSEKILKHSKFIKLASKIAIIYKKEFNTSAPRCKKTITTEELILENKSGFSNFYQNIYEVHVVNFLKENPPGDWDKLPEYLTSDNNGTITCLKCKVDFKQANIASHIKSKNHLL